MRTAMRAAVGTATSAPTIPASSVPAMQGDEHGEAHEVDAGAHDARDEEGVLEVDVDEVEEEDAGHLGPGVERGDEGGERDGDDSAGDGDDVQQAHEDAEQEEVADVQQAEDDGAADAEDEHEQALAEEPLAHADLGFLERDGEAQAVFDGEERHEPAVGVLAFEHEVDAEDEGGDEVEDAPAPSWGRRRRDSRRWRRGRSRPSSAMASTPSLSASGMRLTRATMAGMRAGRSSANWRRSWMTGGRPTTKNRREGEEDGGEEEHDGDGRGRGGVRRAARSA